jgi:hypothetical protein
MGSSQIVERGKEHTLMDCPSCGSGQVQTLAMAYQSGTTNIETTSRSRGQSFSGFSVGSGGWSSTSATKRHQHRAQQEKKPPGHPPEYQCGQRLLAVRYSDRLLPPYNVSCDPVPPMTKAEFVLKDGTVLKPGLEKQLAEEAETGYDLSKERGMHLRPASATTAVPACGDHEALAA